MDQDIIKFINDDPFLFHGNSGEMVELTGYDVITTSGVLYDPCQDDTLDASTKFTIPNMELPISPRGPPKRDNMVGDLNFSVEVNSKDINKKKYLYSHSLNRIYVDIACDFPMQFNWDHSKGAHTMYVRSTVVFSDEAQAEKRVETCLQHKHGNDGVSPNILHNVLHSSRELGTEGIYYCGLTEVPDSWYSLVVQLTKTGAEPCKHAYKFVCKNSCSTGINRRPIIVIFTLEDQFGNVFGRQTVGVRVCSCPRRDIRKDEEAEGAPRATRRAATPSNTAPTPPLNKKIKREVVPAAESDEAVFTLPPLQVIGSRAMRTGLEVMLSMMQQAADLERNNRHAAEKYNKIITEFKRALDGL